MYHVHITLRGISQKTMYIMYKVYCRHVYSNDTMLICERASYVRTGCLQPEVHLGLRGMGYAVAAKVHLVVLHENVPQCVPQSVVFVSAAGEGGVREEQVTITSENKILP